MYRYPDNVYDALLANANAGGDNTPRGFVIGAVMGAAIGGDRGLQGMHNSAVLQQEIDEFVAVASQ